MPFSCVAICNFHIEQINNLSFLTQNEGAFSFSHKQCFIIYSLLFYLCISDVLIVKCFLLACVFVLLFALYFLCGWAAIPVFLYTRFSFLSFFLNVLKRNVDVGYQWWSRARVNQHPPMHQRGWMVH